ncbi:hypothetical protein BDY21DRAFT_360720 [Lineolata rhizophorae]|uniref:Fe2OG dioxygenase domain-containing protein n=1 Tax=Lineolata rhizophorae TaxID=578093 RepID=A0A6A6PCD9_9PEZI|nr:hypothetical protein BDY21DRAFT_360720 [Lineolata rhizophorae]
MAPSILVQPPVEPSTTTAAPAPPANDDYYLSNAYRGPSKVKFDPSIHLSFTPWQGRYTLSDLGLPASAGANDFGTTEPFQLASPAAVLELRRELLQESTLKKRLHWWHRSPACLRGYTAAEAPFIHQFWTSPEVIEIVSEAAGIQLEVCLPYEIGHTNVQLGPGGRAGLKDLPVTPAPVPPGWQERRSDYDDVNVDDWHVDSFPYTCVLMLSNTDRMVGGETALRLPGGEIRKLRGPTTGSCVMMQGRHMPHAALRAWNTGERITMTCPYRPKHPALRDDTEITNSLQLSYLNELFGQFALERFRVLQKKSEYMIGELENGKKEAWHWIRWE